VAPKTDPAEFCGSQSDIDLLEMNRPAAHKSMVLKNAPQVPLCPNCRYFEKEYYQSESQRLNMQLEMSKLRA